MMIQFIEECDALTQSAAPEGGAEAPAMPGMPPPGPPADVTMPEMPEIPNMGVPPETPPQLPI
jgi:hypothetical protein